MITRIVITISFAVFGTNALCKPITPAEFNECIYTYWSSRVNSGLIDAQAEAAKAKAGLYPSLTASYTLDKDFLATPPFDALNKGPSIVLNQQIINFAQWASINARNLGEKAAQLDFEDQLLALMKTASTSFYSQIQLSNKLKLLKMRSTRLTLTLTHAKESNRLRLTDSSSIHLAQADKVALDISIANAQSEVSTALNLLKASVGVSAATTDDQLVLDESYNPEAKSEISYWTKKVEDLPAIQALKSKAEGAGATAKSYNDLIFPTLSLQASYGQTTTTGIVSATNSFLTTATLSFPIFDQGLRSIQAQQADSQRFNYEAQISSKREALIAEIKNVITQWQTDENILKLAKEQLDYTKQAYEALQTLFSFGKTSFVAVRNSENSLVESESQYENIQKKIAGEKTLLELLNEYTAGRYHPGKTRCPIVR